MTSDALYKISTQLLMHRIECECAYKDDVFMLGEAHPNTKHWKERLEEAEEAIKLFNDLKERCWKEVITDDQ